VAIRLLRGRYPQYATMDEAFGAVIVVEVERWLGWAMTDLP
jgi:hypothetical protein